MVYIKFSIKELNNFYIWKIWFFWNSVIEVSWMLLIELKYLIMLLENSF